MEAGITKSYYCNGTPDVNDACLIAMEAGITKSYYCNGITDVNDATHPVMKITLVSQQSKLETYLNYPHVFLD